MTEPKNVQQELTELKEKYRVLLARFKMLEQQTNYEIFKKNISSTEASIVFLESPESVQ